MILLRDYANMSERVLLETWWKKRLKIVVKDDYDQTVETDTYTLMVNWYGLSIHRAYNHIPYSIKEIFSSKIWNDKTIQKPINWFLQQHLMPIVDDPVEADRIKQMIYEWQIKLNNFLIFFGQGGEISALGYDVLDVMDHPCMVSIKHRIHSSEITIDEGEEEFKTQLLEHPDFDRNTFAMLARTGSVSTNQGFQLVIIRGSVFDLNNQILPNPVEQSFAEGLVNIADAMGEAKSAGKAAPLSSPIKVPGGWSTMGEMKVGTKVIAWDGTTCNVIGVHPQGVTKVMRVHFADGRYTDVNPEHLWKVYRKPWANSQLVNKIGIEAAEEKRWRVITTQELKRLFEESNCKYNYIPLCLSEQNEEIKLPMDPYLLGVILGDGCVSHNQTEISKPYQQLFDKIQSKLPDWMECSWKNERTFSLRRKKTAEKDQLNIVREQLKSIDVMNLRSWEKFIPKEYFNGSTEQRLELLRGLLDTDGTVDTHKSISFSSSSEKLAKGVQYLVRSLGGIARIATRIPYYGHKGVRKAGRMDYRVHIRTPIPELFFTLEHKKERAQKHRWSDLLRLRVMRIEDRPDEETQCISIDHPDHLYITDDFIVTHNSLISNGKALEDSEWFHRKLHISTSVVTDLYHTTDCKTTFTVPIKITSKDMLRAMKGKYIVEDSKLVLLTDQTIANYRKGDVLNMRSVKGCLTDKPGCPCGVCYGKMKSSIPYNVIMMKSANPGMYSATAIAERIGQALLSTKHFMRHTQTIPFFVKPSDRDIIFSDTDYIYLTKEMCRPGTKVILDGVIGSELSDFRNLETLEEINFDQLRTFPSVAFEYETEDPMTEGIAITQRNVETSVSSRSARISREFIEYAIEKGWEKDKKQITIDLSDYDSENPLFFLPYVHEDLDQYRRQIEGFVSFSNRNNAWKQREVTPEIFGEVLSEMWNLVNRKFAGINIVHSEIILYSLLTRDPENGLYRIPRGDEPQYFSAFTHCINNRGMGTLFIYQKQNQVLESPETWSIKERQGGGFECYMAPSVL